MTIAKITTACRSFSVRSQKVGRKGRRKALLSTQEKQRIADGLRRGSHVFWLASRFVGSPLQLTKAIVVYVASKMTRCGNTSNRTSPEHLCAFASLALLVAIFLVAPCQAYTPQGAPWPEMKWSQVVWSKTFDFESSNALSEFSSVSKAEIDNTVGFNGSTRSLRLCKTEGVSDSVYVEWRFPAPEVVRSWGKANLFMSAQIRADDVTKPEEPWNG